jgi:hypothetical protein
MSDIACTYLRRDEILVAYLYDDLEPDQREAFAAHVATCADCRVEIDDLHAVRADLSRWTPPEPARVLAFSAGPPPKPRLATTLASLPLWAQVAAALVVLGLSAAVANVRMRYDAEGLTVSTGWSAPAASVAAAPSTALDALAGDRPADAPWRADLAALERTMRAELEARGTVPARAAARSTDDDALLRRVRAMIEASERNQRRELALRVGEVARDVQVQRAADLQRIQYNLNVIGNTTGGAIVQQRRLLNNLAVAVSQQQ